VTLPASAVNDVTKPRDRHEGHRRRAAGSPARSELALPPTVPRPSPAGRRPGTARLPTTHGSRTH